MNPAELFKSYQEKKEQFHKYIDKIKKNNLWDIYTIINPTLIKNPYASDFPANYFLNKSNIQNEGLLFIKRAVVFYLKNIYLLCTYVVAFVLYKIYYSKERKNNIKTVIDVFALVDNVNSEGVFSENYLTGIYEVLEKHNTNYAILLRPYSIGKNPFKLVSFFKIINQDERDFIFEYEFLKLSDFVSLFGLILLYPFKTLRLLQKENNIEDKIFNHSLISDIKYFSFDSLTRYRLGENLSKIASLEKIYSWSEFQVIERSFNYAIRSNNKDIELIGLQFFLNYETYFNVFVDDLDYDMLSSPHRVLVNGKNYIKERKKVKYTKGVSLRYKSIFEFKGIKEEKYILLLGSYIESDTKYMLDSVKDFGNVIFKNHPAVDISKFGILPENITVSNENIYKLFENTKLVIGTASGTALEAVACGISVIIISSQNNLTANPLVKYGEGKIWDIAFSKDDVKKLYNNLIKYRSENIAEIREISIWYRENSFIEPIEENIIRAFELDKGKEA
ncbi:MAG: hypothetical protein Q9M43_06010 [Sulfurimonas sp.]|nr:hypothetical protein [Sulfurimonas sp.]